MINFGNLVALEEGGSKFVNNLEPESDPIHLSEGKREKKSQMGEKSRMGVAPWCCKWDGIGWVSPGGMRYR